MRTREGWREKGLVAVPFNVLTIGVYGGVKSHSSGDEGGGEAAAWKRRGEQGGQPPGAQAASQ